MDLKKRLIPQKEWEDRKANILDLFRRKGNTLKSVMAVMKDEHSFPENFFRAAIEAKDKSVLERLLPIPSIDVNSIICVVDGQKYYPIERAAMLQDLEIVKLFLEAGADVHKTCLVTLRKHSPHGVVGISVPYQYGERITLHIIKIVKVLLQAGAKVDLNTVKRVLFSKDSPNFAYELVSGLPDSDHSGLIREHFLSYIAMHLDDWQATQAINNIMLACERTKCQKCRADYEDRIDWALIEGAKRGHLKLVKLLLLYSKTPYRALSAAIRSGKSEVIDAVFTLDPNINAPAHCIDEGAFPLDWGRGESLTTSHAEAIKTRNEKLLREIESQGALEFLNKGDRFRTVITAASEIGDIEYVRKLLKCCISPKPSHMAGAVLHAIQGAHEEIFRALLVAGADVGYLGLRAAFVSRNPDVVRAVLNTDLDFDNFVLKERYEKELDKNWHVKERSTVIDEAIKWGDRGIIQDLLSTYPGLKVSGRLLSAVLVENNLAYFDFLLECRVASNLALTHCLEVSLSRGDHGLTRMLVERGANPIAPQVITTCVKRNPAMLAILFEYVPFRKRHHVVLGFGTNALNAAIKCGEAGIEAVKLLLGTELVDATSFSSIKFRVYETPLGLAIRVSRKANHVNLEVIKLLLDYGCDVNTIVAYEYSYKFQTALLEAIDTRSRDLVKLLIDRGANVNHEATFRLKRTPLQKAVEVNSLEIVMLLLEAKADVNGKPAERNGATAFQLAAIQGNCVIAKKLFQYGADIFAPPAQVNGRWPIEGAAENGRIEMIFYLWKISGDCPDDEQCQRAMKLAEGNGYMACKGAIEELLQNRETNKFLSNQFSL